MDQLTITYYDIDLKRDFELPSFENVTPEDLHNNHKDVVFEAMTKSLLLLGKEPWARVPSFTVNGTVFEINRDGCAEHLKNCLAYYEELEAYELCAKLAALTF